MDTKKLKIAIEQSQKVCDEMNDCANKHILQDSINDMNQALSLGIVIWRCSKDLFLDSSEQVFTKGRIYEQEKSNSEWVTIDDGGHSHCFENLKEFFIAI